MRYIEKWGGFPREEKFSKPFEKIIAYWKIWGKP
jgi:hypothetical protein